MAATHGEGAYGNATGVTTPAEHKMAQAGEIVKASGNLVRPGLFWGGTSSIITGKANMSYDVAAFTCASTRGASAGVLKWSNDAVYNATTSAAPGSNSRIDIIIAWHREYAADGTNSDPQILVVSGTPAASPSAPSLASYPGCIELGRATVPSGITATTSATITQTAPFTAMDGGRIPFRNTTERDAGTYVEGQLGWLMDTDTLQVYTGSAWRNANADPTDTAWAALPMFNSWVDFNAAGGTYQILQYRRHNGMTEVRGLIKNGTIGAGTIIATLPAGFRPLKQRVMSAIANFVSGSVEVKANGEIIAGSVSSNSSLSLELSFAAEQ